MKITLEIHIQDVDQHTLEKLEDTVSDALAKDGYKGNIFSYRTQNTTIIKKRKYE
jgi:hypothetical protein